MNSDHQPPDRPIEPIHPRSNAEDDPMLGLFEQVPDEDPTPTMPHSPRFTGKSWLALIGVIALLLFLAVRPRMEQAKKLESEVEAVKTEVPSVSVVSLKTTPAETDLVLPAGLQAVEQTTINARMAGYVLTRYVDIGSRVKAGEILADIQSPETDQQVLQSQAEVMHARAGVGQAQADYSRLQASVASARSQAVESQANLGQSAADLAHLKARAIEASSAVEVARARLNQSQQHLLSLKAELQRAKVGEDIAHKTLVRWKELEKADAVSGQDVDEKQSDYDASLAKVEAASADVSSAKADVTAAEEIVRSESAEMVAAQADVRSGEQRVAASRASVRSTLSNLDAARAALDASRSNISAARATVGSNLANVQRYAAIQSFEHITAPFSGVITARNVDVGDLVNATPTGSGATDQTSTVTKSGLFGLARTDVLLAQTNIPEDSITGLHEGDHAEIKLQELPHQSFPGTVAHMAGAVDAASRTLLVEVNIPNPLGVLKPGMFAEIRFTGQHAKPSLRIPSTALIFDANETRVLSVTTAGTLHYLPVKLGRDFGGEIEVTDGLRGNETLVTNPDISLNEGQKVNAISQKSKS